ncbi:MAG: hypothetical protein K2X51_13130 [Burkholderiales bacterium]|nr:hypothetical protein [Burkholderiales bacterium]
MSASPFDALAGSLRVSPGVPVPDSLSSSRQDRAARLGEGRLVETLPGLMASVFNLCSHAHRLCSQLAIEAAAPGLLPAPLEVDERLRLETVLEHVRRIGLEWPVLLGAAADEGQGPLAAAGAAMRGCPLLAHSAVDGWADAARWLQQALLGMPARDWQAAWEAGGSDWLGRWSAQQSVDGSGAQWLATLVCDTRAADTGDAVDAGAALHVHAHPEHLHALAAALALTPGFALQPQWRGACAHTGSWTRLHGPNPSCGPLTPWALLGSRLAELVRLCLPDDRGLAWGALSTGPRRGLAWVEMARGLLVHQVALDDACSRVVACQVLAPTEWNFHPGGEVAQRVSRLDARSPEVDRQLRLLMAAFDPCVPFDRVAQPETNRESAHA